MESRREFLKNASILSAALGLPGSIPESINRAFAIDPAPDSTYLDAEHVVFLMQENRSFDHAFGTLKGVRGFNDPRAISLPNGNPVWLQSNRKMETFGPFRLDIRQTNATWMGDLPHSWADQVDALNKGRMDGWLEAKKSGRKGYGDLPLTMGYYTRDDIPFYYHLADSFTICDQHFCSSLTGTSPNRCFFWTGKVRAVQNEDSKPHTDNGQIDGPERLSWSTFPELLQQHGIDWRIYQNELSVGIGFEKEESRWLSNFNDNDMEFFKQYHVKRHPEHLSYLQKQKIRLQKEFAGNPNKETRRLLEVVSRDIEFLTSNGLEQLTSEQQDLHRRAFTTNRNDPDYHALETIYYLEKDKERSIRIPKGDVLYQFRQDVKDGKLPTVSWLVAPGNFSDHPAVPWYGAWYVSEVIDILTKNPEVWKKTIFVLTYDENDGYFDHIPPFGTPNPKDPSTGIVSESLDISSEFVKKGLTPRENSIGLGFRVPMIIVSPWSRGGYVNSQVFDHTSSIQFLEHFLSCKTRSKIFCEHISSWRRSLCGDLTSVFRPYNGAFIPTMTPIERIPYFETIRNAEFAELTDKFLPFDPQMIDETVRKGTNRHLPCQEPGIKPVTTIPYEPYTTSLLNEKKLVVAFKSGKQFFGERTSGVGFNVYAPGARTWSFTVDAGDSIHYEWPLDTFDKGKYDLKIYSSNGFFRHYQGGENDPVTEVTLYYTTIRNRQIPDGNVMVSLRRLSGSGKLRLNLLDHSYGGNSITISMGEGQKSVEIPVNLKRSHGWYDFSLTVRGFSEFRQHFAGHVEHGTESFTDPLMGNRQS